MYWSPFAKAVDPRSFESRNASAAIVAASGTEVSVPAALPVDLPPFSDASSHVAGPHYTSHLAASAGSPYPA
jgi:hypothetical protein